MSAIILQCSDFEGRCCNSCHEDNELGYADMIEVNRDDGSVFAIVCCRKAKEAYTALDDAQPDTAQ